MAEVLHDFGLVSVGGTIYHVRVCGSEMDDALWQGWLEFEPLDGGDTLRSPRETTQPNRTDTVYWATGLTPIYIEGALERAINPPVKPVRLPAAPPAFDEPAPRLAARPPIGASVLDPFAVYQKGEVLLRERLNALSTSHLVGIVTAYNLSEIPIEELSGMPDPELIELIIASVRISVAEHTEP